MKGKKQFVVYKGMVYRHWCIYVQVYSKMVVDTIVIEVKVSELH